MTLRLPVFGLLLQLHGLSIFVMIGNQWKSAHVKESDLEREFDKYAGYFNMPPVEKQLRFAPPRRFRFDRSYRDEHVAIELDGGVFSHGQHVRGIGYENNCVKNNLAIENGWVVLHYTSGQLRKDPMGVMRQIMGILQMRRSDGENKGANRA